MSCTVIDRRSNDSSSNSGCRLRGSSASLAASTGGVKSSTAPGDSTSSPGTGLVSTNSNNMANAAVQLRPTKPCCFCWCCCCSCSCLPVCYSKQTNPIWLVVEQIQSGPMENEARIYEIRGDERQMEIPRGQLQSYNTDQYSLMKGVDDNGPTKNPNNKDILNCDGEPPPTIEEIRSWGKSFDKLMRSSAGRKVFRDFLRCEYSEENILFWLACEELKREANPDAVEEKARFIYEDYISILSPKEVSLDSRVREIVNRNMMEPTPHTFDEAQLQIYTLMHRDSYPRFVNSPRYKQLAQVTNGNGGGGSDSGDPSPVGSELQHPEEEQLCVPPPPTKTAISETGEG